MITSARIAGIPPFTDPVEFVFDEQVNLFIGPNASGKSTILRQLVNKRLDRKFNFRFDGIRYPEYHSGMSRPEETLIRQKQYEYLEHLNSSREHAQLIPWIFIPSARLNMPFSDDIFAEWAISPYDSLHKIMKSIVNLTEEQYVFDGKVIYGAAFGIGQLSRSGKIDDSISDSIDKARSLSAKCAQYICRDVLVENAPRDYIQDVPWSDTEPFVHHDMGVRTIDIKDRVDDQLFIGDLSSGTQSTLLWIWYLAIKMGDFYGFADGWEEQPAILLIDEIENHLHPTWQRRVIPALRNHFPGLQIFATTHSPFVVAGLKAGQVHRLKRDENGVVSASRQDRDIIGWTIEEILHSVMGVNALTDEETANKAARLKELQSKDALTEDEAAEMEDIRAKVSRDILAGGALNAQRDRYADMMQQFLRSRLAEAAQGKASD